MNGRSQIDYTNKDYDSLRQALLELATEKLPTWTDQSANDVGVVLLELFTYLTDVQLYYQDRIANESFLDTAVEPRSIVNLLRLIGYELRPPQPASADLTLLFDENAVGLVNVAPGTAFQTDAKATGTAVTFQYTRDLLTLNLGTLPLIAHTDGKSYKRFEPLPVTQVDEAVASEVIGSSDGSPNQRFSLSQKPLIEGSLVVSVDEGAGPRIWQLQPTLLYSQAADLHYAMRRDEYDTVWAEFGDNKYSKIPRRGRNNLTASYLVGGGMKGNVPPNTIKKAVTAVDQLKLVFNKLAATGGADAETSTEASRHGPQHFRAMGRAVTTADYEYHAKAFGVGKSRARAAGWNRINLFVAPVGGGYPSNTLKEDLRLYFENKRIMTSIVEIEDPIYTAVFIEGTLDVEAYYFTKQVQQQVENAIRTLLAFDNVHFEDRLYLSKVYEKIEAIDGVAGVNITRFAQTSSLTPLPDDGILSFGWNEIPQAGYAQGILLTEVKGGRLVN